MNQDYYQDLESLSRDNIQPEKNVRMRIRIDDEYYHVKEGIASGAELLALANKSKNEYSIFVKYKSGGFNIVPNDESLDLTIVGIERFITSKIDSKFKLFIDGKEYIWGVKLVTGKKLKEIAGVSPTDFKVWRDIKDSADQEIRDEEFVVLREDDQDRFFTVPINTTAGDCITTNFIPRKDATYLNKNNIIYNELIYNQQVGIILSSIKLPEDKFDHESADFLVVLPTGYPDVSPDMFYCNPWLKLSAKEKYPHCADVGFIFGDRNWQRWSRHGNIWRQGIDGIWTMVLRIEYALNEAS